MKLTGVMNFVIKCGGGDALEGLTTEDVNNRFQKEFTKDIGLSYCDMAKAENGSKVGKATVFISHAWKYKFMDLLSALKHHFRNENDDDVYIWFDLFSVNQHISDKVDPDWWNKSFMNAVKEIGHVVLVLSPWQNPIPFTRAWCLWEIYCAIVTGSKLEVAMDSGERQDFVSSVRSDSEEYMQMLGNINVKKSEAWKVEDRDQIFAAVESMEGGFDKVNSMVCSRMRELVIGILADSVDALQDGGLTEDLLDTKMAHAGVLSQQGQYAASLSLYEECLQGYMTLFGQDDLNVARTYNNMAVVYKNKGDYDKALEYYTSALTIKKAKHGDNHPSVANTLNNMANVYDDQGDYDKALEYYTSALTIRKAKHGDDHPSVANTLNNMANVYRSKGDYDKALEYYTSALTIYKAKHGDDHPDTTSIVRNIGLCREAMS